MSAMKCKCGTMIQLADPPFEVQNGRYSSTIVFNHGMMGDCKCPSCGFEFMGFIQSFDHATLSFTVGVMPVPVAEKKLIEEVPAGFDVRSIFRQ